MRKVVCLVHREYDGSSIPPVSCKNCCKIYVDNLTEENQKKHTLFMTDRNSQKLILEKRIKRKSGQNDVSWI